MKHLSVFSKFFKKNLKGFTLIELLVVIGILAVLFAITLIAINPGRQFSQSNNTKRQSDVNSILNAINQYMADNKGALPQGITGTSQDISNAGANICQFLVPIYIAALPVDPLTGGGAPIPPPCATPYDTNYWVFALNNRVTVSAPAAELGVTISVTR